MTVGNVTVHWSVNTSSAPAGNGCTPASPTVLQPADLAANGTLHMAVQAEVEGEQGRGKGLARGQREP